MDVVGAAWVPSHWPYATHDENGPPVGEGGEPFWVQVMAWSTQLQGTAMAYIQEIQATHGADILTMKLAVDEIMRLEVRGAGFLSDEAVDLILRWWRDVLEERSAWGGRTFEDDILALEEAWAGEDPASLAQHLSKDYTKT